MKLLSEGERCPICKKIQIGTSERHECEWCAYDRFIAEQFEAELTREDPDFSDFYGEDCLNF